MAIFGRFGHRGPYRKGQIIVRYTKFLTILETIGCLMLLALVTYTAFRYAGMPEQIPTHYNGLGEVDGWGSKTSLWIVPGASALTYGLLTLVAFFPGAWNYPGKIPAENLPAAENKVRQMLMFMKLLITALFFYLQLQMLKLSESVSMGVTFVFLLLMLLIIVYFMGSLKRLSKNRESILKLGREKDE